MKRLKPFNLIQILLLGAFSLLALNSCDKDDEEVAFEPKIVLESSSKSVPNGSSQQTSDVLSNGAWQVESNVDWISFPETSGEKGRFDLMFSVAENDDDERIGMVTISTDGGGNVQFEVIQEAGNRDDIYVKLDATGEGFSWAEATNLKNALEMAVTGNTIHIAEGTYTPTKTITGGDPADEADKTFEISTNLTMKGGYPVNATEGTEADPSQYSTILSGEDKYYHVVAVTAPMSNNEDKVVLQGLTISNGFSESSNSSSATINGIRFLQNYGGGIIIGAAKVDIIECEIIDNKSSRAAGIYAFEGTMLNLKRSQVSHNIAEGHNGGVWIDESRAFIIDSEINANECGSVAGAIYGFPESEVNIYNSVIANNKGKGFGAAYYLRDNSKGILVNVIIAGNSSTSGSGGGGVFLYDNSEVNIVSSTITLNTIAGPGGGVYQRKGANSISIYNSIISGNEQKNDGPEIDAYEDDAQAPIIQASIVGETTYNKNSEELEVIGFDPDSMLQDLGDWIFVPIGEEDNPAVKFGLSVDDLIELGGSLEPEVEEGVISKDILHKTRANLKTMGAVVNDE